MGFRPEEKGIKTRRGALPQQREGWDSDLKKKGLRLIAPRKVRDTPDLMGFRPEEKGIKTFTLYHISIRQTQMGFRPEEKGIKTNIPPFKFVTQGRWDSDLKKKGLRPRVLPPSSPAEDGIPT